MTQVSISIDHYRESQAQIMEWFFGLGLFPNYHYRNSSVVFLVPDGDAAMEFMLRWG